jgi:23S rRNA pseudouridine1911/1915/1917 synthase
MEKMPSGSTIGAGNTKKGQSREGQFPKVILWGCPKSFNNGKIGSMDFGFSILYENGPCLAVSKPSGVATQAPPGIDSLEARIKAFLHERDHPSHEVYLAVPHRLDRPASGAMVFATRRRAAQKLSKQFENRTVKKIYWAWVAGTPDPIEGTWRDSLRKVYGKPLAEVVPAEHPDAKPAVLHYRTVAAIDGNSLLEIELETGRTHQIRIQAASRGWPILGDFQYGSTTAFGPPHDDERLRAIALHARTLEFEDPASRHLVLVVAPLPEFWPCVPLAASPSNDIK